MRPISEMTSSGNGGRDRGVRFTFLTSSVLLPTTYCFTSRSDAAVFHPQYHVDARGYMAYVDKTFRFVDEKGTGIRSPTSPIRPPPNLMYQLQELQAAKEQLINLS